MRNWSRSEKIALLGLLVAAIACFFNGAVVPDVRRLVGLPDNQPAAPAPARAPSPSVSPSVTVAPRLAPPPPPVSDSMQREPTPPPSGSVESKPTPPVSPPVSKPCVPREERIERGIAFVRICPGTFTMGSNARKDEKPAHQVTMSEFWIGKTEITNEQYRRFRSKQQGEAGLPVTNVNWFDANTACKHLGGRLPTEAEWEYAARAGNPTAWSFGDDQKVLGDYAWYAENSGLKPHPVGTRKPNAWGLYDMHGNVREWVDGRYVAYPDGAQIILPDLTTGRHRVFRGGSFADSAQHLRSAFRDSSPPMHSFLLNGFRCASDAPRQSSPSP